MIITFDLIWFVLDAIFGLFPPIDWAALVFGLPCSIVYFILLALFIAASMVPASWDDEKRGAFADHADRLPAQPGRVRG